MDQNHILIAIAAVIAVVFFGWAIQRLLRRAK